MGALGALFYIAGIGIALYAGYEDLEWFLIFIASALVAIGYMIVRAPQMAGFVADEGILALPKIFIYQVIGMSILTGILYLIGIGLSSIF